MTELADTSAWLVTRCPGQDRLRQSFDAALVEGDICVCDIVRLELLSSADGAEQFDDMRAGLDALQTCPIGPAEWRRALDVYQRLAQVGADHRSIKHADLLIAAAAEARGIAVLHYDEDFDRIAQVTGQRTRWIADKGSVTYEATGSQQRQALPQTGRALP